jgi:hypothetical protein
VGGGRRLCRSVVVPGVGRGDLRTTKWRNKLRMTIMRAPSRVVRGKQFVGEVVGMESMGASVVALGGDIEGH